MSAESQRKFFEELTIDVCNAITLDALHSHNRAHITNGEFSGLAQQAIHFAESLASRETMNTYCLLFSPRVVTAIIYMCVATHLNSPRLGGIMLWGQLHEAYVLHASMFASTATKH